ncbi:MAG: PxKF domain-containing protein [Caldilineaceae bacterium]
MSTQSHFFRNLFRRPRLAGLLCGASLAVAQFFSPAGVGTAQAAPVCTTSGNVVTCTFSYSGAAETWTVPAGVTSATFDLYGAQGGNNGSILGGRGGRVTATLNVSPDVNYQILVGGAGSSSDGGFNGGGHGNSANGGGASDVRTSTALIDRLLVAGGGGGGGGPVFGTGGAGGYPNGGNGNVGGFSDGGKGGTQTSGGAGGLDDGGAPGGAGTLGQGGNSGSGSSYGGGGGGGYYGGGGGAITADGGFFDGGGGGGGSSYGPANAIFQNGVRSGDGLVIITYTQSDTTGPVITPNVVGTLGANGWYVSDVTISWSVVDNESTISTQSGCTAQSVTSDTSGVTFTCSATSAGGSSSQSVTIKRDATAPTITFVNRTAANGNGWNNSNVTVNWSCSDATSGVVAASVSQTVSGEGTNQSVTGTCTDNAGNNATNTQSGINIDKTAPTLSAAATTQPNANGWYNSNVTVQFTCADALSGLATNACPADQVLSSEGAAVASTAQTVTDLAGNTSVSSNVVTVKLDKAAPVVTVTGVSNGATYPLGSVPAAGCSTSDALSGVATQATLNVTGGNPDGTGSFTATCSGASDNAGNSATPVSVTYTVAYNWTGFFQRVDNLPVINTANAGASIPVKFSLGGNYGLNIFASGSPTTQKVSCNSSGGNGSTSPIDQTATTSNSGLQYDPTTQTYTYVWKTDKAWAGTCRTLLVKLIDGTTHTASFQFNGKVSGATVDGTAAVTQQIFLPVVSR